MEDVEILEKIADIRIPASTLNEDITLPERQIVRLLVRKGNELFTISYVSSAPDHLGPETLVFTGDFRDKCHHFRVGGGQGVSIEAAIGELCSTPIMELEKRALERSWW